MARKTNTNTRNLARRFRMINDATSRSLLDLVQRYEEAAEDQQAASTLMDRIDALEEQINNLEELDHRTAKQEAKIKSLVKKIETLEKKLDGANIDCDMSAASVESILEHMIEAKHLHIANLEWQFNDCK